MIEFTNNYSYQLIGTPENGPTANVVKRSDGAYVPIEGGEYQKWLAEGNTPDPVDPQFYLDQLRNKRNRLLAETDYLALSDQTMSDEMTAYRQALRDLPDNTADPENPVWPTKP